MSDAVRDGDSSRTASPSGAALSGRSCALALRLGHHEACGEQCPFWEEGGAVVPAGCGLERILTADDWPPELAGRWLSIRDHEAERGTRQLLVQLLA